MTKESYQAWTVEKRPIYSRMPEFQTGISHKDFSATSIILDYWDSLFINCLEKLEDLVRQFNPEDCDEEYLDFLAPLCGWTSPYWLRDYPSESKRLLLKNSYSEIWNKKGSREALSYVLNALSIDHRVVTPGSFILGYSELGINEIGTTPFSFTVYLPTRYTLAGYEFKMTDRICQLFSPVWCEYVIEYDPFNLIP